MLYRQWHLASLILIALNMSAWAPTASKASFVILTNPSQFGANSTLITFDEGDFDGHVLQPFDVVTSYRGVGFEALGAPINTWPQAAFDPSTPREFGPGGDLGKTIIQDLYGSPAQGLQITLPSLATQFGAEFEAVTLGNFVFTLFDGGQQVDVVTVPAGEIGFVYNFHAFEDSSAFDRVIVNGPGFDAFDGRVIMDNLRFSVPEPSTLALILLAIVLQSLAVRSHRGRRSLSGSSREFAWWSRRVG